jgi:HEAT repeat protein
VPPLIEALKDKEPRVRAAAASSLYDLGPAARASVPLLVQILESPAPPKKVDKLDERRVRSDAARALGGITRGTDMAVKPLVKRLSDEDSEVAEAAAIALGKIGPAAQGAIEPLREVLKRKDDATMPVHAAAALARIDEGKYLKSSVALLAESLRDKRSFVRYHAVRALYDVGTAARDAAPALLELVNGEDKSLAQYAAGVLKSINPEAARKAGIR